MCAVWFVLTGDGRRSKYLMRQTICLIPLDTRMVRADVGASLSPHHALSAVAAVLFLIGCGAAEDDEAVAPASPVAAATTEVAAPEPPPGPEPPPNVADFATEADACRSVTASEWVENSEAVAFHRKGFRRARRGYGGRRIDRLVPVHDRRRRTAQGAHTWSSARPRRRPTDSCEPPPTCSALFGRRCDRVVRGRGEDAEAVAGRHVRPAAGR